MKLRPYQEHAITELRRGYKAGHIRQVLATPSGATLRWIRSRQIAYAKAKGARP